MRYSAAVSEGEGSPVNPGRAAGLSLTRLPALIAIAVLMHAPHSAAEPSAGRDDPALAYRVVRWTTAEGLPQNTISDAVHLPNGELWLATFGGLARFDGRSFKVIDIASDEGLPANRIVGLAAVGADSFLFLTQDGHLGRVERERPALLVSPPARSMEFRQLTVAGSNRIYGRSTNGQVWETDGATDWHALSVHGLAPDGFIRDMAHDSSGDLWGATDTTLVRLTGPAARAVDLGPPHDDLAIATRPDGGLWIAQPARLGRFDGDAIRWAEIRPMLVGRVWAIGQASGGTVWIGAGGSLYRVDAQADGTWQSTRVPVEIPPQFPVRSISVGRLDTLWVGTAGAGLYRLNPLSGRRLGSGLGAVGGLADDGAGGAFAAAGCGTLFHIETAGAIHPIRHGQPEPPCQIGLATGDNGRVWARVGPRLVQVSQGSSDAPALIADLPNEEGPIAINDDGSIWVVSRGGGVELVSAVGARLRTLQLPAPLVSAAIASDHALWVGGEGEVFRVAPEGVLRFGQAERIPRGQVRDVLPMADGSVWVATYGGGLGCLRDGRVARVTADNGLPDNSVSRMLLDGVGRMWISTNRGVAVVDLSALEAVAEGRAATIEPVVLGPERGVPEANFGSPAGFVGPGDRLWFGTIDGLVVIDGAAFPFDPAPPAVRIERVRRGDQVLGHGPVVEIPPLTARVALDFTAFELVYPERVRFRFRFEGVDPDWVDAGSNRFVEWTPLRPGRYRFLVEGRSADGIWSANPATIALEVLPAWWQTTLFRAGSALGLAVLAAAGVMARFRGIERRHAARLRALREQRDAEQRMSDLRARLEHVSRAALAGELAASIAHEVRQPLGAIVNNAEAGRRRLPDYLQRPADLEHLLDDIIADAMRASQVVQGLRGFLQPRSPEAGPIDLSNLVHEVLPLARRELQDNRIAVDLALAGDLPIVEGLRVQIGQIVLNLVINACEALTSVAGDRRIRISTAFRDGRVELAVRDNGPGLPPSMADRLFEPFVTTKPGGLGVGLAICRSIAERHGGRLQATTPPEGGVVFTLSLPVAGHGGLDHG